MSQRPRNGNPATPAAHSVDDYDGGDVHIICVCPVCDDTHPVHLPGWEVALVTAGYTNAQITQRLHALRLDMPEVRCPACVLLGRHAES